MMLDVQGLRTGYGRIPILNGVSFSVHEGEFIGILGHNGMGKTTLLKALMGFLPATGGRVLFGPDDVTAIEPYRRARLGLGYRRAARFSRRSPSTTICAWAAAPKPVPNPRSSPPCWKNFPG
jgi:ABC-type branched-subunit amino acid transport system ATPase component